MARAANTFPDDGAGRRQRGEPRVKSGARVAEVLDLFRRLKRPLRGCEIAEMLDLAPSSTNDLLKTLAEVGYLDFDRKLKSYFPGIRAALFAQWLASVHPNPPHLPRLEAFANLLRDRSGQNVVLFAHQVHQVQVISVTPGDVPPPGNIYEGATPPVFGTAAGGAVMMVKSPGELDEIARRVFRSRACGRAAASMSEIVQTFKRRGYASSLREDIIPDNWAIAVPLPAIPGHPALVVGLGGPIARVREQEPVLAELVRSTINSCFGRSSFGQPPLPQ